MVAGQVTTRLPVRSALLKQRTGGLLAKSVTISEVPPLYGFFAVFWQGLGHPRLLALFVQITDNLQS